MNGDGAPDLVMFPPLPLPPSENGMYATVRAKGRLVRIKSREANAFHNAIDAWAMAHKRLLDQAKRDIENFPMLCIKTVFYFDKKRIFTKDGRIKKLDASNFVKAANDAVARILGIDDSRFFRSIAEKAQAVPEREMLVVTISRFTKEL